MDSVQFTQNNQTNSTQKKPQLSPRLIIPEAALVPRVPKEAARAKRARIYNENMRAEQEQTKI